ncbi:alpha/beta fold hydrolase [Wenjunlia tyrosinilytica]|uniref:AB hydrolase-1 domain-containing protein n=1 Tax=Wenjunlia tyrosinilytica TaxID=1544741 RepID=A0A918E178_9ACTN|nr:alpha/beta hydrolase [Wenjunlia tyrosinilytica]GGO96956.1 hypothetical protein GCM10012280_57630 [Wenjunlia tyrosinilytica]
MARSTHVRTSDGTRLHAVVEGPDDAPLTVVLAHGWTLTHASWAAQVAALTATGAEHPVRTVTYDQRGHGRSERGAAVLSIDLLGDDLARVLAQTAPEGPVVLVGHSMGGMTVMALAASRPELFGGRVVGVLLTGTSAGGLSVPPPGRVPGLARAVRRGQGAFLAHAARHPARFERLRRLAPPTAALHRRQVRGFLFGVRPPRQAVLECARMIHDTPIEVIAAFFPAIMTHDKSRALSALSGVPVSILCGSLDKLTPVSHTRALAAALPHARVHIEAGCGHMLQTERPDVVSGRLRELVADVHPAVPRTEVGP